MTDNGTRKSILMLGTLPWHFDLKYLKNLAAGLSRHATVIYYYPPQDPINIYTSRNNRQQISLLRESFQSYTKPLTIFVPFTIVPFARFPVIGKINALLNTALLKLLYKLKSIGKTSYLFVTFPFDSSLISSFTADRIIYDCMDIPRSGVNAQDDESVWNNHKKLTKIADTVFVNSSAMRSLCTRYNRNTHTIPSGFVYDEFRISVGTHFPGGLRGIRRPFAGFIGLTFVHLDIPLLLKTVSECRDVSFIFVGPTYGLTKYSNTSKENYANYMTLWKKLLRKPNVYHIGKQERKTLGEYINAFDVCIIPYDLQQKSALYANAIKAYEYLYFGKRIVSTPLKPLKNLAPFIAFAETADTFSRSIRASIQKPITNEERMHRINTAKSHDIDHKVASIISILSSEDGGDNTRTSPY